MKFPPHPYPLPKGEREERKKGEAERGWSSFSPRGRR